MDEREATQRVTQHLFEAIGGAIDKVKADGAEDAISKVGPVLVTTGVMILVQSVGAEATAKVVRELADRVERGDFSQSGHLFDL